MIESFPYGHPVLLFHQSDSAYAKHSYKKRSLFSDLLG